MTITPPRVFVSYSHDSASHKAWVLEFATTLRNRGVDAILDQWDLKPGDDLPEFMEQNLSNADFAIMICTKRYVEKANAGEGGVGYEKMIMTSASLTKISDSKVIPIVREKGDPLTPTFLITKLYIDFTDDRDIEFSLDQLLRTILNSPLYEKPEIGSDPFRPRELNVPDRVSDGVLSVMKEISKGFSKNTKDYLLYSQLVQNSSLHRLTLDKYLSEAEKQNLISRDTDGDIHLTESGLSYLSKHGIVDA